MGTERVYRKFRVSGPLHAVGSADFGTLRTTSSAAFAGVITSAASHGQTGFFTADTTIRVNTPTRVPVPGSGGFTGYTRLGSGATSVVISTTAVKSDSLIMVGMIQVKGAAPGAQASGSIPGPIMVSTISHGGYFTMAWMGGVSFAQNVDVPWQIVDQA